MLRNAKVRAYLARARGRARGQDSVKSLITQARYSLKMPKKRYTKEDKLREARAFLEKMIRKEKGVLIRITQVVRDK